MTTRIIETKFKKSFDQKKEKFERLPLKKFYVFSFFLSLSIIAISFLAKLILPPEIPLFYGFPQSQQRLSQSIYLFIPSLFSLLTTAVNAYISIFIDNNYLKRVLAFSSVVISFLSATTTIKIIFLVGRL